MRSRKPPLVHYATRYTANGRARPVAVSLPHITCIASEQHYTAPPSQPKMGFEKAPLCPKRISEPGFLLENEFFQCEAFLPGVVTPGVTQLEMFAV
jgi:hypothetical protein